MAEFTSVCDRCSHHFKNDLYICPKCRYQNKSFAEILNNTIDVCYDKDKIDHEQLFYIQDSRDYVGNSPLWWGFNFGNYTTDIDQAGLYTEEEAMKQFESRETDIPWKKEDVERAIKRTVDHQYLTKSNSDGFYTKIEEIQEQNRLEAKKRKEEQEKNDFIQELEYIRDEISWGYNDIKDEDDFTAAFAKDVASKGWYSEYEYYTTYKEDPNAIFNKMIEYKLIFKCPDCESYYHYRDDEYPHLCQACGEEQWYKDNPDD